MSVCMSGYGRNRQEIKGTEETYRNSCLAVLVGEVGKSSSLPVKEAEKQKTKRTQQNMIKKSNTKKERGRLPAGNLGINKMLPGQTNLNHKQLKHTNKITKGTI